MFAHAATGIPKHTERIPLQRRLGEDELATSVGEDAFFHRGDALGIADGVGGWAGVADADPALFARRLMHHVCREMQRYEDIDDELFSAYYDAAPVDVLRRAYEITADEMAARAVRGSSTACVVVLRGDELRVANLGDCGLTVVRQGDMVYRTEEQQHSFNFPYQLGTEAHADAPSDAQVFRLKVQKGDVVVVGSDGVFDNLFDEDILEEVGRHLPPAMRATGEPLPDAIARRARLVSEDTRYAESPFQMRAMQEGLYYQGGKRDDITVVVAVVTDLEDAPDRR
ncbi:phosphatase 2C-like domain-containing protein [Coemansia mojavensis]|nr:phosphatase 2C-like domain-containing protein [Coemansia mojavensis]